MKPAFFFSPFTKLGLLAFIMLSLLACFDIGEKEEERLNAIPAPLADEQTIELFYDVHIIEAAFKNRSFKKDSLLMVPKIEGLYDRVFAKHGITEDEFDAIVDYYTERPVKYELIYEKVIARFENELIELEQGEKLKEELDPKTKNESTELEMEGKLKAKPMPKKKSNS
ncbi:DUF4296 domain-containing protein [Chitinophagales bacterium]|nr:DUF4296 domain-containing protein [Chitinophagales bacterium]